MENVSLTLSERFDLSRYVRRLPSTLKNRFAVEGFLETIEFTPEELTTYAIRVSEPLYALECTDPSVSVTYPQISDTIVNAMKEYIEVLDTEDNKGNQLLHNTFDAFKILTTR